MTARPQPLIVVVGPTASGKTALALRLARRLGGEVVGADAYQIYRGMDVGTAKPTAAALAGVRHHLLDVADPDEHFDAHRYLILAREALAGVAARGATAIVAGGTGLYARALVRGLADMPGADAALRASLEARAAAEGRAALHGELARVDPAYAARISPNDLVRIVRALEVHALTGRTITAVHEEHARQPDAHPALWLGLDPGQDRLRARIEARTAQMFEAGFEAEVRRLLAAGYGPALPPLRALGYGAVCRLVEGEIDEPEARRLTCRDTGHYARRQRNWFRHEPDVHWLATPDDPAADELVDRFRG